jgi:hypothetical protein
MSMNRHAREVDAILGTVREYETPTSLDGKYWGWVIAAAKEPSFGYAVLEFGDLCGLVAIEKHTLYTIATKSSPFVRDEWRKNKAARTQLLHEFLKSKAVEEAMS